MKIIVHGPAASGKTRHSKQIAEKLGVDNIIDGFRPIGRKFERFQDDSGAIHESVPDSTVVFTCMRKEQVERLAYKIGGARIMTIEEAKAMLG